MSSRPPPSDDPLAALAKAAQKAVQTENTARAARLAARDDDTASWRRRVRVVTGLVLGGLAVAVLAAQGPRMADPYYGEDPLADPRRAKAYAASLLDIVLEWRVRNGGNLPTFLGQAVPQNHLPEAPYAVNYRVESGVPVLTLEGGREPVVVRGAP